MFKVLIVEDELDVRETFADILENSNCTVQTVASATDAMKVMPTFLPDLVLLDMHLRGATGSLVLAFIRRLSKLSHTKVVIVSGHPEMAQRAVADWGADQYLEKPVMPETLRNLVKTIQISLKVQ